MKKRSKKIIVISVIILLIFSILFTLAYWQRNNLTAIKYALNYSPEEQVQLEKDNEKLMLDISEKFANEGIETLSDEAVQMLNNGDLTEEEAVQIITQKTTLEEVKRTRNKNSGKSTKTADSAETTVANLVAKIYILRSTFVNRLDSLIAQGKAELKAGTTSKGALAKKYLNLGLSLEAECDAQMEAILAQIKTELQKSGGDMSLIQEIRSAYNNEKSIKKASIISQYAK